MRPRLVAIVGTTASGKSALALELAGRLGGQIVNSDSRQVYIGMDIGTAKPSTEERGRVPHHLFDIARPEDPFSLAVYTAHARKALSAVWARGSLPLLVGGTGQYAWALLEAWQVPEVPPDEELRATFTRFAAEHGYDALHARLRKVDPASAGVIDARNVRRVVRALEVYEVTGRPFSAWQSRGDPGFDATILAIDVDRDELDRRIRARVEAIFAGGFVEEVESLLAAGLRRNAPSMSSIGYSQVAALLGGELTRAEAMEETARATRRLARRQEQWFRRTDRRLTWLPPEGALAAALESLHRE